MQVVKNLDELCNLTNDDLNIFFDADDVDLSGYDLRALSRLEFKAGARVNLSNTILPQDLDVSMCDFVDLSDCDLSNVKSVFKAGAKVVLDRSALPRNLDVSMCGAVSLCECDLSKTNVKLDANEEVFLRNATNLSCSLHVTRCGKIDFTNCDMHNILCDFKKGAVVNFDGAHNFGTILNVSRCASVDFINCDLSGVSLLILGKDTQFSLKDVGVMPVRIEALDSDFVDFSDCDLSKVSELMFKKGAVVDVSNAKLPEVWDVSKYEGVHFRGCNLAGVREIRFRDKKQKREFLQAYTGFSGKAVCGASEKTKSGKLKYVLIAGAIAGGVAYCSVNEGENDKDNDKDGKRKIEINFDKKDKDDGSTIDYKEAEDKVFKIKKFKEETRRKRDKNKEDNKEQARQEIIGDLEEMLKDMNNENAKNQNSNRQGKQKGNKKPSKEETINTLEQMLKDMEH